MPLSTFLDGFSRAILPIIAQLTSRGTGVELAHTIPDASAGHRVVISLTPIAHTDERYLCLCVDLGQIAEPTRFWNPAGAKGSTLETVNRSTYDFGRIRLRNMASALAPGHSTFTLTQSIPKSGKNCVFVCRKEMRPATIIMIISKFAAVGWRTKKEIKFRFFTCAQ